MYSGISILSNSPETNRVPCHLAGNERHPRPRGGNSFIYSAPRVEIFAPNFRRRKVSARSDGSSEGEGEGEGSDYSRGLPFATFQNPLCSPLDATIMLHLFHIRFHILYTRADRDYAISFIFPSSPLREIIKRLLSTLARMFFFFSLCV